MGRNVDADTVVGGMLPLHGKLDTGFQIGAAAVEIDHTIAQHGTDTAIHNAFSQTIHPEIHIIEGSGAVTKHFHDAKIRSCAYGIIGQMLFDREDRFIQPTIQREIVADAAKKCQLNTDSRKIAISSFCEGVALN